MANNRNIYQQTHTVSIPRKGLIKYIIKNQDLKKKDLRVILLLLTELDGYEPVPRSTDPENFKRIDINHMSQILSVSKSDIKKTINYFCDMGVLEEGSSAGCSKGYRFTF